jgi:hypothetical protein
MMNEIDYRYLHSFNRHDYVGCKTVPEGMEEIVRAFLEVFPKSKIVAKQRGRNGDPLRVGAVPNNGRTGNRNS